MKIRYLVFAAALIIYSPRLVHGEPAFASAQPGDPGGQVLQHFTTGRAAVNLWIDRRTFVLDHMFFQPGGAGIHPAAKRALNGLAAFMADDPEVKVGLSCETFPSWSEDCDNRLSNLRVESVRSFLLDQGIQADRVIVWRELTGPGGYRLPKQFAKESRD